MGDSDGLINKAAAILRYRTPLLAQEKLDELVGGFISRRDIFLDLISKFGSPLYIIEPGILLERAAGFDAVFRKEIPRLEIYYALKSNNHPIIIKTLASHGYGIDVSSGWELDLALENGAERIIFSGPGKTDEELRQAVAYKNKLIVLMDSPGELERLDAIASETGTEIRAGIRLTTNEEGLWKKFGIPLSGLSKIFAAAEKSRYVNLCGIQFHTSWNMNPEVQCRFIERLGKTLENMPKDALSHIDFIDIGGGYWPPQGEWLVPAGTIEGRLLQEITEKPEIPLSHYCIPSEPLEEFARALGDALKWHIYPHLGECRVFTEPGRWLCNDAMHIALTVIDRKHKDMVVTDGGINIVGWERFENDYAPVINLSDPALSEHACYIFGSLCTPHDVWGYSYHGRDIKRGDVLLIPNQGAYTWSLRQNFIKPLPRAAILESAPKAN